MGYAAAELFIKNNPDWGEQFPALMKLPDTEIYQRFVDTPATMAFFEELKDDFDKGSA